MESHGNRTIFIAIGILLAIILFGILGFMRLEGYSFVEALYMTIITISTVGFKEVHPLSNVGMWFTIMLIIFSLGLFAFSISLITKHLSDRLLSIYNVKKKMEKTDIETKEPCNCGWVRAEWFTGGGRIAIQQHSGCGN